MKLYIKKLILWPKNHDLKRREINFSTDKINVLTGESGTGKSTISMIVDYCLGSGKCAIPVGLIREKCEWYGVLIGLAHEEMLIARHDPEAQQSTGDMYIQEGPSVTIPSIIQAKNINVDVFKDKMNQLADIPKIDVTGTDVDYAKPIYPAFRDMAAFTFQPQHIVANPYTLFFKTDTTQHREKLRTIFPFVLGSVTPAMLVQQKELKDLEKEIRFLEQDYNMRVQAAERWLEDIEGYYIQARHYGLLPEGSDERTGWCAEQYLSELRTVRQFLDSRKLPDVVPGSGEEFAKELQGVMDRENQVAREVGDLTRRISKIQTLGSVYCESQKSAFAKKDRLQSVGWLRERIKGDRTCPICAAHHSDVNPNLQKLLDVVQEFSDITRRVQLAPSRLDVELADARKTLRAKEQELKKLRSLRSSLQDKSNEQAQYRQETNQIYRFAGRLEQALESFSPSGRIEELKRTLSERKQRANQLKELVNRALIKRRFDAAMNSVSRSIEAFAQNLKLEHLSENVALDAKELTVKFGGTSGRIDYLWEVGSGQNWVGYHLATMLALHSYLLALPNNPVPSFLIVDQPSQVYFPESSWTTLEGEPSVESKTISEDIKGVQRIFSQLSDFIGQHSGEFQIIVTEHAGEITWKHVKDKINLVGNWRDGKEDYLIPNSWM